MKEWKLKKVIQILTACLAMIVVLNVSGISMKTMQTIDINKKESKRTDEIQICKWSQKHGKQYPGF